MYRMYLYINRSTNHFHMVNLTTKKMASHNPKPIIFNATSDLFEFYDMLMIFYLVARYILHGMLFL